MASSGWLPGKRQVLCGVSPVPRAWVKPGEGKANRRLPPDRRSRAGMPSRDRGRRAQGTGDRRAAVAEMRFVEAGRPEGRRTKARHRMVAGWRPDEGREGQELLEEAELLRQVNRAIQNRIG